MILTQNERLPAFKNILTGQVRLSRDSKGHVSPIHRLDYLPTTWIAQCDQAGRPCKLKSIIIAGYMWNDRFYSRAEAAAVLNDRSFTPIPAQDCK